MRNIILITFSYSLIIIMGEGFAYAQTPPQNTQVAIPIAETVPQVEVPKRIFTVNVENKLLSVEFADASFGEILTSIANKAGFAVEGSADVLSKRVTTKFHDLDIDSGIIRLFSIVKESNYLINYDANGSISKLKVYNVRAERTGAKGGISSISSGKNQTGPVPAKAWRTRGRLRTPLQPLTSPPSPPVPQASQVGTPEQQDQEINDQPAQ